MFELLLSHKQKPINMDTSFLESLRISFESDAFLQFQYENDFEKYIHSQFSNVSQNNNSHIVSNQTFSEANEQCSESVEQVATNIECHDGYRKKSHENDSDEEEYTNESEISKMVTNDIAQIRERHSGPDDIKKIYEIAFDLISLEPSQVANYYAVKDEMIQMLNNTIDNFCRIYEDSGEMSRELKSIITQTIAQAHGNSTSNELSPEIAKGIDFISGKIVYHGSRKTTTKSKKPNTSATTDFANAFKNMHAGISKVIAKSKKDISNFHKNFKTYLNSKNVKRDMYKIHEHIQIMNRMNENQGENKSWISSFMNSEEEGQKNSPSVDHHKMIVQKVGLKTSKYIKPGLNFTNQDIQAFINETSKLVSSNFENVETEFYDMKKLSKMTEREKNKFISAFFTLNGIHVSDKIAAWTDTFRALIGSDLISMILKFTYSYGSEFGRISTQSELLTNKAMTQARIMCREIITHWKTKAKLNDRHVSSLATFYAKCFVFGKNKSSDNEEILRERDLVRGYVEGIKGRISSRGTTEVSQEMKLIEAPFTTKDGESLSARIRSFIEENSTDLTYNPEKFGLLCDETMNKIIVKIDADKFDKQLAKVNLARLGLGGIMELGQSKLISGEMKKLVLAAFDVRH